MTKTTSSVRFSIFGGVLMLQACTTTMIATPLPDFTKQAAGQVYYLPRTEYQITIARELKACAVGFTTDADAAALWFYDQLTAVSKALETNSKDPVNDAAKLLAIALNEPVLQQVDTRQTVKSLLANTWLFTILDAQAKATVSVSDILPKSIPKEKLKETLQAQIQDALAALKQASAKDLPVTFDVEINAQAVPLVLADTQQAYAIDFNGMQNDLKGSDYTIESYPNGTLKSINVTIDDQTGDVVKGVIGGAAKLAAGIGGFPFPSIQAGAQPKIVPYKEWKGVLADSRPLCNADVRLKLLQRAVLVAKLEADADVALATQKRLTKLGEAEVEAQAARDKVAAKLKDLPEGDASKPKLEATLKLVEAALKKASKAVVDAKEAQGEASEAAANTAARFAAVRKALTVTTMTTVAPVPAAKDYPLLGEDEAMHSWLDKRLKRSCAPGDNNCTQMLPEVPLALAASAALSPVMTGSGPAKPSENEKGIWYRQPLKSNLYVCIQGNCLANGSFSAPPSRVVLASPVDVPQFGPLAFLLLENKAFQNNTIAASFAESGALTKLTYKTNASAAKAAEVFESSADTVMKFKAAKQNQGAAKATAEASELEARKKLVDAQLALEKAQADLDKFRDEQKK